MNLTRLPLLALLVLSLFGGAFAVGPTPVAADDKHDKKCHEHCDDEDGDASVVIDGGDVSVSTAIDISADGGVAAADASGGDLNVAIAGEVGDGSDVGGGDDCKEDCEPKCHKDCEPKCEKDCEPKPEPPKKCDKCEVTVVVKTATTAKGGGTVAKLPATGTGTGAVQGDGGNGALILLAALGALGAAGYGLRRRIA